MKTLFILLTIAATQFATAQTPVNKEIRQVLENQIATWNKGDLEGYMQTYWKSDSLIFIGKSGITRGWQQSLDRYKTGYPDTAAMGKLFFDIIEIKQLSPTYCFVVGKWMLKRSKGDLSGYYDVLMRKIKGHWLIISDHSS